VAEWSNATVLKTVVG